MAGTIPYFVLGDFSQNIFAPPSFFIPTVNFIPQMQSINLLQTTQANQILNPPLPNDCAAGKNDGDIKGKNSENTKGKKDDAAGKEEEKIELPSEKITCIDIKHAYTSMSEHEILAKARWCVTKSTKKFGNSDPKLERLKKIFWWESGIPYIVVGSKYFVCEYGKRIKKSCKEKEREKKLNFEHSYTEIILDENNKGRPSKKQNCPASCAIREIIEFPEYKCEKVMGVRDTAAVWRNISQKAIAGKPVETVRKFVLTISTLEVHCNHPAPKTLDQKEGQTTTPKKRKKNNVKTEDADAELEDGDDGYDPDDLTSTNHLLTLNVSAEQEKAIEELFQQKGWDFVPLETHEITVYSEPSKDNPEDETVPDEIFEDDDDDRFYTATPVTCPPSVTPDTSPVKTTISLMTVDSPSVTKLSTKSTEDDNVNSAAPETCFQNIFASPEIISTKMENVKTPSAEAGVTTTADNNSVSADTPVTCLANVSCSPSPAKTSSSLMTETTSSSQTALKKTLDASPDKAAEINLDESIISSCQELLTEYNAKAGPGSDKANKVILQNGHDYYEITVEAANDDLTTDPVEEILVEAANNAEKRIGHGKSVKATCVSNGDAMGSTSDNKVVIITCATNEESGTADDVKVEVPRFFKPKLKLPRRKRKKTQSYCNKMIGKVIQYEDEEEDGDMSKGPRPPKRKKLRLAEKVPKSYVKNPNWFSVKCPECQDVYRCKDKYANHKKDGQCVFACEQCEKAFTSREYNKYLQHLKCHSKERSFKCQQCDRGFVKLADLRLHMKTHRRLGPAFCDYCGIFFDTIEALQIHKHEVHKCKQLVFKCEECGQKCCNKNTLKLHEKNAHSDLRPYSCLVCGERFKAKKYLYQTHAKRHPEYFSHKCQVPGCRYNFDTAEGLAAHIQRHSNLPSRFCSVCDRGFYSVKELKLHMRSHSGGEMLSCPHCEFLYSSPHHLRRHLKTHTKGI